MSGTCNQRLKTYASLASIPTMAAAGGMAVTEIATADIVYQSVSLAIGGEVGTGGLDMGFASVDFSAGTLPGLGAGMGIKGSEQLQIIAGFSKGSAGLPKATRFVDGEGIGAGPEKWVSSALGAASFQVKTKKGSSFSVNAGEWNNADAEPVSGYMGFAFLGSSVGEDSSPPIYGWISLAWDGATLTIDGYAYEDEAGVGIAAGAIPAPGAIGLLGLAAGAAGMRRKRQA